MKIVHYHHSTVFLALQAGSLFVIDPFKLEASKILQILNITPQEIAYVNILVSHPHFDHLSKDDILLLTQIFEQAKMRIIYPASIQNEIRAQVALSDRYELYDIRNYGEENGITVDNIKIYTSPAYNINKVNPNTGEFYHPVEKKWAGFVLTFKEATTLSIHSEFVKFAASAHSIDKDETTNTIIKTIYFAGDTDVIPEMHNLRDQIDLAFLPVSGTYVMTWQEALEAEKIIQPKISIPIHYGVIVGSPAQAKNFVTA